MADELKPCPFCGGEASGTGVVRYGRPLPDTEWLDGSPVVKAFFANCTRCGVRNGGFGAQGYQTSAEAIAAWNRRA
jgi:hypothetical protein